MLRPSLTLVLDLDERCAQEDTILEVKRNYAHIGTPVIRTHAAQSDEPARNVMRCLVNMGAYRFLMSADEGADEKWTDIIDPWLANLFRRVGNNMKVFNDRQRSIGLPELVFDSMDVELQSSQFIIGIHPDALCLVDPSAHANATVARNLLNDGTLTDAIRVDMPTAASFEEQRADAWTKWVKEHPEAIESNATPESLADEEDSAQSESVAQRKHTSVKPIGSEDEETRERRMREDTEAKSYENTAVAPTDSSTLPPVDEAQDATEEEEEEERFDFDVDYSLWEVTFADGTKRIFDSTTRTFVA